MVLLGRVFLLEFLANLIRSSVELVELKDSDNLFESSSGRRQLQSRLRFWAEVADGC